MAEITASKGILKSTKLHVEDTGGAGRPVVLIHGWPLSGASWSEQVPALEAAGYRVITYDRRGFGQSDKPSKGYDYDSFAEDLKAVLEALDVEDATLVGFSMGGGEVARYLSANGSDRIHSVVFAAAVPPYLAQTDDNPDGPLTEELATQMETGLREDERGFYEQFVRDFFTAEDKLEVDDEQLAEALALTEQADHDAALGAMEAFGTTDFRDDLTKVDVPALIIHGDGDGTVPFEGSGKRTHAALTGSELHVIAGGPHGINVSHADEFNRVLLDFLQR